MSGTIALIICLKLKCYDYFSEPINLVLLNTGNFVIHSFIKNFESTKWEETQSF